MCVIVKATKFYASYENNLVIFRRSRWGIVYSDILCNAFVIIKATKLYASYENNLIIFWEE